MKPSFATHCLARFAPACRRRGGSGIIALALLLFVGPTARADSILLRGGERLIGRVLLEEEGKIQFESQTLGVMEIPRDRIERIERDAPPPPPEPEAVPEAAAQEKTTDKAEAPSSTPAAKTDTVPTADSIVPAPPPEAPSSATVAPSEQGSQVPISPSPGAKQKPEAVDTSIMPAPPPDQPTPPTATTPHPAPTTAAVEDKDTITAGPPSKTTPAPVASAATQDTGGQKPLPVTPPPTAVTVTEVKRATELPSQPAVTAEPPAVSPPAPAPVFYPWSGLRTEQDTFDWIQLKSGEWLKGEIKSMQDEKLGFDSEEMDYREIDWEDVTMLRSPRMNSVWFEKTGTADGSLLITPKEVRVVSKSGTNTYPRSDLLAITHAGDKEFQKWSGEVSLGFNIRTGNAEEATYNAHINLQRRTPNTRLIFDYLGNFSRINGAITSDNLRETTTFDYFLSRRLYIRAPDAEIYRDPLQNISRRLTLGASVGYDFIRKSRVKWDVSAGPAYQSVIYDSVEPGDSPEEQSATLVISSHVEVELTKKIDWTLDFRSQYTGQESTTGNTQHINSTLEFDIHKRLNLDISAIWDHVGSPKTNTGGTTPSSDDFRLITSLGIDF